MVEFFKYSDIDFNNTKLLNNSSYGNIYSSNIKGKDVIVKSFKYFDIKYYYHNTTVKEININNILGNLIGLIIDRNFQGIVLQKLDLTLYDYFESIIYLDKSEFNNKVIEVVDKIIVKLNEIAKYGFIHRDIKANNIMFNSDGELFLIDYGLSIYNGIFPPSDCCTIKNLSSYTPNDYKNGNTIIYNVQDKNEYIVYNCDYLSNSCDIYSIGIMLLSIVTGHNYKYFSYEDNLYYFYNISTYIKVNNEDINKIKSKYEDKNIEVIYKMINIEPLKRLNVKENKKFLCEKVNFNCKLNYYKQINNNCFIEDIIKTYSSSTIPILKKKITNVSDFDKSETTLDVLLNTYIFVNQNFNEINKDQINVIKQYYNFFYDSTYRDCYNKFEGTYYKEIYKNSNLYIIRHFYLFISYIQYLLQCNSENELLIRELISFLYENLICYVFDIHHTSMLEVNIYSFIKSIYNNLPNKIDIDFI
jgi:serine/threonine protein kinase